MGIVLLPANLYLEGTEPLVYIISSDPGSSRVRQPGYYCAFYQWQQVALGKNLSEDPGLYVQRQDLNLDWLAYSAVYALSQGSANCGPWANSNLLLSK